MINNNRVRYEEDLHIEFLKHGIHSINLHIVNLFDLLRCLITFSFHMVPPYHPTHFEIKV
jgi:hypothetical protein